ncbi:transcription factor PIF1-like [Panicum miliaceum]|uniref:Transcription factor PIF1-like n=1 Tax=Panicum miliaceum TaxID=4540 RepID=A0A3L6RA39_PANMI|nr:transcription factor PIF1-like [Panicum miliaceum]
MNSQGSCPALYYSVNPSEAAGGGAEGAEAFLDMFGDRQSSGDLFDLLWQGGARGSSMEVQPAAGHLPPPSPAAAVALPPSDDEMAAWLYPIVRGDHPGVAGHAAAVDDLQAAPNHKREKVDDQQVADHHKSEDKLPKTEEKCRAQDPASFLLRKKATGGARKSHHAQTHNRSEKRRRCKINEKFKTLQHLVPGCHNKSNQVSPLDQTIQYMKSLQRQIQAMSFGCGGVKPAAVYPVMSPAYLPPAAAAVRPGVVLAPPPAMVPFGPMLPLVNHHQYPAAMASAPTLYPAAAVAPNVSVVAAPGGRPLQNSHSINSRSINL